MEKYVMQISNRIESKSLFSLKKIRLKCDGYIIKLFTFFSKYFLKRNTILFESFPDFDGSPWMIYNELIKRGYNQKYKLIWLVDKEYKRDDVLYKRFFKENNLRQILRDIWIRSKAKVIIDSNRYVYKINPKTFRLHTRHGGTLKSVPRYSKAINNVDYILSLSDEMAEIEYQRMYNGSNVTPQTFLIYGYPNNDRLFNSINSNTKKFFDKEIKKGQHFDKIIGWMPTYRNHRKREKEHSSQDFPFGLPLLYQPNDLSVLNDLLHNKNILLVIKIHHAQLLYFPKTNFSNIITLSQDKQTIPMMDLIKSFDALITDYSSIYHEYLLLDRPIALAIDDFETYSKNVGFWYDYFDWIKGVYLKNISDLLHFVEEFSNGYDSAQKEREAIKHRIHKYIDNQSTKRVVDFLVEKAKL